LTPPKDLKLQEMLGGAIDARFTRAILDVASNIDDPNTDAEATRKIVVTLVFKPDAQRKAVRLQANVETKLAGNSAIKTTVFSTFSRENGCAILREIPDDQPSLFGETSEGANAAASTPQERTS